jgi:adenosylmethionine-8-amino-7-oxononanoate aminotransferase
VRGDKIEAALEDLKHHPRSKNFRRCGMIFAFDAQPDEQAGFARRYFAQGLQQQILLRPIGNTVYLMPPYIINDEEINCLATGAIKALEASC